MKKQLTLITALLLANIVNAQWQWAKQIGGPKIGRAHV